MKAATKYPFYLEEQDGSLVIKVPYPASHLDPSRLLQIEPLQHPDVFRYTIEAHIQFSIRTFGPGAQHGRVTDHISKEIAECDEATGYERMVEWCDIAMIGLDGAWRHAHYEIGIPLDQVAQYVANVMVTKLVRNHQRTWPPAEEQDPGKATHHVREESE